MAADLVDSMRVEAGGRSDAVAAEPTYQEK
jgi:hypothetical protein